MIYDVNSPQFQQFLRSSGRRREDFQDKKKGREAVKEAVKPGGGTSTGL